MTVNIHTGGAPVTVLRHVGVLRVQVAQTELAVVGTLAGVGMAATPMGWTAGYTRQRWAALGAGCRAVLWTEGGADAALRQELERLAGVCLLAPLSVAVAVAPAPLRTISSHQEKP